MKDHLRSLHKIDQHVGVRAVPDSSVAAQVSIAESFRNIADYGIDGDKNKKINDAIIYMISKDVQPFSIVENPGFIYLMNTVAPRYKIPSRYMITKWVDDKFLEMKEMWKRLLNGKTLTITMDVWMFNYLL